jgi:hypothetical protein
MKKVIFLLLVIVVSNQVAAQIKKGQWLAGGNVNWTTSFNSYGNSTVIKIMPDVGFFFLDKLAGGLKINHTIVLPSHDSSYSYSEFGFSPFLRYYFLPAANTINVFAEVAYGWGGFYYNEYDVISHQWSVFVGAAFFLNRHVALEAALNYTNITEQNHLNGYPKTLGLNFGFQVYLGK